MEIYSPTNKSYVHIAKIPRTEIKKIDIATCNEPAETLDSFYKRQAVKPDLLVNCSLFGMSSGIPCFGLIDEGKIRANDGARVLGVGVKNDADIAFGHINDGWRDWVSGYPVLVQDGKKTTITDALDLNYKAKRMMWGFNNQYVYIVAVEDPGMLFNEMQDLMCDLGCSYAINLDGGGSVRMLQDGKKVVGSLVNRPVDNVLAIYLKTETSSNTTSTTQPTETTYNKGGQATMKIIEDIIPQKGGKVRPGYVRTKKWIVIHETGNTSNGSNAKGHSNYLKNLAIANTTYKSWHYTVDDHEIYHHIPDNEVTWNAGDGSREGGGNFAGISMELCINSDGNFEKTMDNAAWLTAKLLKENNLTISAVKQHHDFSGKNCPQTIREKGLWNNFLTTVKKYYTGGSSSNSFNTSTDTSTTVTDFKVNDVVQFTGNTHYKSSDATQGYTCKPGKVKVTKVYRVGKSKHPYMVVAVSGGGSTAYGWVDEKDLKEIEKEGFKSYTAKVTANVLNVRSGPGTGYKVVTAVKKNEVYTIVEEKNGFGKLKSGAGWISLKYVKLVKYV